jgi:hypothetical protein
MGEPDAARVSEARRVRAGLARVRALPLAAALGMAVVTFLLLRLYLEPHMPALRGEVGLQGDEGTELYNSDLLRRGWRFYADPWDFKGPIGYLVFALGYCFSSANVEHGRVTIMLVIALWSALAFLCGRAITGRNWPAILLGLFVPLCVWPNWPYAYNEYVSQCALTGALLAALHAGKRPRLWVLAGVGSSLAFWTSLGQGLPGALSLAVAAVLLAWGSGPNAARVAKGYALGFALPSALITVWLVARGTFVAALRAIFVFPFTNYMAPINETAYGVDRAVYVNAWLSRDHLRGVAVRVVTGATVHTPQIALGLAIVVAFWLLELTARRYYAGTATRLAHSGVAWRLVLPAALVACAVPVILGATRSDICHLGFVEGTSSFAICAVLGDWPLPSKRWLRVSVGLLQAALGLAAAGVLAAAGFFLWKSSRESFEHAKLDPPTRDDGDFVAARTRPEDRVYMLPLGGYHYLSAQRDNAISYAVLDFDAYYKGQWERAAGQVSVRRPRLMLIGSGYFDKLVSVRPELKAMYFGYSGNYILDARRPGPALAAKTRWQLNELEAGKVTRSESLTLEQEPSHARAIAKLADGVACLAALDEDRVSIFHGTTSYVGRLTDGARRIEGTVFNGETRRRFEALAQSAQ